MTSRRSGGRQGMALRAAGLTLCVLAATGCGASLSRAETEEPETAPLAQLEALFPEAPPGEARAERIDGHVALVRAGRVYGSTGEDMPGQVLGMLEGLALAPEGPAMLRVGLVGFGTGTDVAVALAAGSRVVDVFERDPSMVRAGETLAGRVGLVYQSGQPVHPSLRLVGPEQAARERLARYDVLVVPSATSAIVGPARLVTVERLQGLAAVLGGAGLLVHHLPAYEMTPEAHRRFLRTFAEVFPSLLVVVTGPAGGDTFVVASAQPIRIRPRSLAVLTSSEALEPARAAAGLVGPMDLAARVLFASREEVLAFAEGALPCTAAAPLAEGEAPPRPPEAAVDAPEAERAAAAAAIAEHRARFERMDLLRARMLGMDWEPGQVCPEGIHSRACLLDGVSADESGAAALAELALSLMAVGRFVEARLTVESAAELAAPAVVTRASEVLDLLIGDVPDLAPFLPNVLADAREAAAAGACDEARAAVAAVSDPEERLVAAWITARCSPEDPDAMAAVAELLDPVADEAHAARFPGLLYLLARAAMVRGAYAEATWTMAAYARAAAPPTSTEE